MSYWRNLQAKRLRDTGLLSSGYHLKLVCEHSGNRSDSEAKTVEKDDMAGQATQF
jgi:hypothetical protein